MDDALPPAPDRSSRPPPKGERRATSGPAPARPKAASAAEGPRAATPDRPREAPVIRALVVEGGAVERRLLGAIAEGQGLQVREVADGATAVRAAEAEVPDVILLDMELPDADGLRILSQLHSEHPDVPVVVLAHPSDADRIEAALDLGAVNFVCKPVKPREIVFVIDRIRRALRAEAGLTEVLEVIVDRTTRLEVPCDLGLIPRVVSLLGRELQHHYPGFRVPTSDVKLALYEALANAMEHGSLEIDFEGKAEAMIDPGGLQELVRRRQEDPRFRGRKVHVDVHYGAERVEYVVRDDGPGFDPRRFVRREALTDVQALHGRGLALIRHYMNDVRWNDAGNEIRMARRLARRHEQNGGR